MPTSYPPIDDLDCVRWILNTIAIGGSFVAVHKNRAVGSLGVAIAHFPWNHGAGYLHNEWFFVHPKFRRYGVAKRLLDGAKALSSESGRPFIFSLTSGNDKRVARFFAMQGFSPVGEVLTYGMGEQKNGQLTGRQTEGGIEQPGLAG